MVTDCVSFFLRHLLSRCLRKLIPAFACLLLFVETTIAQSGNNIIVQADKIKATVNPAMWGVFFEDINMGADGGIYAEMVKNRSFEFFKPLMGWAVTKKTAPEGAVTIINRQQPQTTNPRYIQIKTTAAKKGELGLTNEGFRGMGFKKDSQYIFSVMCNSLNPGINLYVQLVNESGKVIGETKVGMPASNNNWQKTSAVITATETSTKGKLTVWIEGDGILNMDMISLFPKYTWKNRTGGLRADMVQMLADMKPGFVRFPGGCIVEGFDLSQRYEWKKTIGPVEDRQMKINRWNFEFPHRAAPDYFQTFGLGFFEYFQLAEDIGAAPLPILNCGMACQFNSAELVPLDNLDPYIQDALDLVEFANGDATSRWGSVRAGMGHPSPFHLQMIGIGNENWGPQYIERLKLFKKAINEKYPEIKLVTSSGTDPAGERFDYLNTNLRTLNADFIDEHYYRKPEWFLQNASRYDTYPRNGSKVFAGEYAAQSDKTGSATNKNNWTTAMAEAAFMTGLERNADVVEMASYAPLFAHTDGWQWNPDLIWVNNLTSYGTPNYYVQKLYSVNKGTHVVPLLMNNEVIAGQDSLYANAVIDKNTNEIIIKIVNASADGKQKNISISGVKKLAGSGKLTVLKTDALDRVNSFENSTAVIPVEQEIKTKGKMLMVSLAPYSFSVIRVKMNQ